MIILTAGHDAKFTGACNPDYRLSEHHEAARICDLVMQRLLRETCDVHYLDINSSVPSFPTPARSLQLKVARINRLHRLQGVDLAIDLHFNASPSRLGHGAETLCHEHSAAGACFAACFAGPLEDFDGKFDGRTPLQHSSTLYFLRHTACPALILEPLFLDNNDDAQALLIHAGRMRLVEAIVDGINAARALAGEIRP